MSEPITISLPGRPVQWSRARTGNGHHFTPQKQRDWMALFRDRAEQEMAGRPPIERPVKLEALFTLEIPQSWSGRRKDRALLGLELPGKRPDVDNYIKIIADSINAVVIRDDALVCDLHVRKRYGVAPSTVITVTPL